MKMTLPWQGR